jgi:hypothetical protein
MRTFDEEDGADPRFHEVLAWAHDHGQSLDWLFDGDVGPMICRRASKSPIATAIPDPAFDAIEHFQASWKAVGDACDGEPDEKRSPLHAAWATWDAKQEAVNSAHSDAEWDMVQTIPTTRAGAVAMITAYIEQSDLGEAEQMLLETLAEAIPHLV